MRRSKTQKDIDDNQDKVNERQDLVNTFQTTVLLVYGAMFLGIFILAVFGGLLKWI